MPYVDRCIFTATSTGTGDFVVSAAVAGYQTPAAASATNGLVYGYAAQSADLSQWEVGKGAYTSGSVTLARTTVLFNNLGTTAKINFTLAPNVMITALAEEVASLNTVDQVVTGGATVTSASLSAGNITIDCGKCPLQFISNNAAYTLTAPANDGSAMVLVTNTSLAGATTFSGFTVGSNTGDALTTTSTNKFTVSIWRINSVSGYRIAAHQ